MVRIGVVSVQGAFTEHEDAIEAAAASSQSAGSVDVVPVRRAAQVSDVDGIVIPGGESTAISKLLASSGLHRAIVERVTGGAALLGTCAGAILVARRGDAQVERTGTELLGLMDIAVERNAYGRQVDSFETDLRLRDGGSPLPGVFIRAPAIVDVWGEAEPLVWRGDEVVGARQGRRMALTFHPELGGDTRLHAMFLAGARDAAVERARAAQT